MFHSAEGSKVIFVAFKADTKDKMLQGGNSKRSVLTSFRI